MTEPVTVAVEAKSAWKSKTVWLNGVAAVGTAAGLLLEALDAAGALAIQIEWGDELVKWSLLAVAVSNLVLRRFTVRPVTLARQPEMTEVRQFVKR